MFPLEGRYGLERMSQPGFNYKSCNNGFQVRAHTLTSEACTTGNLWVGIAGAGQLPVHVTHALT